MVLRIGEIFLQGQKAIRYVRLYGLHRTWIKIKGQYHSKADEGFDGPRWINPRCRTPGSAARNIAIIGCGNYAFSNICYYLAKEQPDFLKAVYDIHRGRAVSLCREFGGACVAGDWRDLLADPAIKLVFIASNHASHAEYAIEAINAGKHVHIEKPHVVSHDQLTRLSGAMRKNPQAKVFLGFNRPRSELFQKLVKFVADETGPLTANWFVAGHQIEDDHWYFEPAEGGRVLGNLCHWTDLSLHLAGLRRAFPCTIVPATPTNAKSDFIVSAIFADRSCAAITFSAKGHTFEGVREILNLHKGDLLANLADFQILTLDKIEKQYNFKLAFRDHGHLANIVNSYRNAMGESAGKDPGYVLNTARFFLGIREAIEEGNTIKLDWDASFETGAVPGKPVYASATA